MPDMTPEEFQARAAAIAAGHRAPLGGDGPVTDATDVDSFAAKARAIAQQGTQADQQPADAAQGEQPPAGLTIPPYGSSNTNRNAPASTGAVVASRNPLERPEMLAAMGAEPGQGQGAVPFDPNQGASWMTRLGTQFAFNKAQAEWLLKRDPAVQSIRYNSMGDPVLRIKDQQTGEEKDILANPPGLDWGDSAFLVANAPLLVGGFLAGLGKTATQLKDASAIVRALMSKDVIPTAARMAVGGRAAQAVADVAAQHGLLPEVGPAQPNAAEVATREGVGGLTDFLFGTAVGGTAKAFTHVVTPTSSRGPIQVDAANAEQLIKKAYADAGHPYYQEITPGEATGSPILQRTEAYEGAKPGSSGVFQQYTTDKIANDNVTKRILLGADPSAVPPADIVGQNVIASVKAGMRPIDELLDRTSQEVLDAAQAELKAGIAQATKIPTNVEDAAVGKALISGSEARHEAFRKADADLYNVVHNDPRVLGQGRNIDATPLAKDAQELLSKAASVEKQVEVPSYDAYGSPIAKTETRVEPITSVLNPNTTSILKQLSGASGGKVGLSDLIEARTDIGDAMSRGKVLGGIGENRLGNIYGALTRRIQTGLEELDPSGGLRKAWEKANEHHAENIAKFQATAILPMFKDAEQAGSLTVYDAVNKAIQDQGKWAAYRDFFGDSSNEMNMLRRAFADRIVGRTVGSDTVDMGSFLQRLQSAYETKGDIVADVFKGRESQLKSLAEAGAAMQKGGQVDAQALADNIAKGTLTKRKLEQLAIEQHQRSEAMANTLLTDIVSGKMDATPSQIVDHIVFNPAAQPDQVRKLVSYLADQPQTLQELQQRTLVKLFNEASSGPRSDMEYMQSNLLRQFLRNQDSNMVRDRLEAVLGGDTMKLLDAVHDVRRPGELKAELFSRAGQLATAGQIANIEKHLFGPGMIGQVSGILKSFLLASLYNTGPTRAYIANQAFNEGNRAAFTQGLMLLTPTVRNLTTLLGGESARLAAIELKARNDKDVRAEQRR